MTGDLFASGPVAIAQLSRHVFPWFSQKGQNRLVAFLSPVFRVLAYALANLIAEQCLHRGVGIQSDGLQIHMSGLPYALTHRLLPAEDLPGHRQMQRGQKPPERALWRQSQYS